MPWTKGSLLWVRRGRAPSGLVLILRKSLGTAVLRNRIRRRLRHICRQLPNQTSDLVVLVLPPAGGSSFAALRAELIRLVQTLEDKEPEGAS